MKAKVVSNPGTSETLCNQEGWTVPGILLPKSEAVKRS